MTEDATPCAGRFCLYKGHHRMWAILWLIDCGTRTGTDAHTQHGRLAVATAWIRFQEYPASTTSARFPLALLVSLQVTWTPEDPKQRLCWVSCTALCAESAVDAVLWRCCCRVLKPGGLTACTCDQHWQQHPASDPAWTQPGLDSAAPVQCLCKHNARREEVDGIGS